MKKNKVAFQVVSVGRQRDLQPFFVFFSFSILGTTKSICICMESQTAAFVIDSVPLLMVFHQLASPTECRKIRGQTPRCLPRMREEYGNGTSELADWNRWTETKAFITPQSLGEDFMLSQPSISPWQIPDVMHSSFYFFCFHPFHCFPRFAI